MKSENTGRKTGYKIGVSEIMELEKKLVLY